MSKCEPHISAGKYLILSTYYFVLPCKTLYLALVGPGMHGGPGAGEHARFHLPFPLQRVSFERRAESRFRKLANLKQIILQFFPGIKGFAFSPHGGDFQSLTLYSGQG